MLSGLASMPSSDTSFAAYARDILLRSERHVQSITSPYGTSAYQTAGCGRVSDFGDASLAASSADNELVMPSWSSSLPRRSTAMSQPICSRDARIQRLQKKYKN